MSVLPLMLLALGTVFLVFSLKPAFIIYLQGTHIGWKILFVLINLFIVGYLFFSYFLINKPNITYIDHLLVVILFAGGIFVMMTINLSLKSIRDIQLIANQEKYNSLHDSLTGLANRKYFLDKLSEQLAHPEAFTLFIIDINNFKQINDLLGHYHADQLLTEVAININQQLSSNCFLARIAGDQFATICSFKRSCDIEQAIASIQTAVHPPFNINGYNLKVRLSIGATQYPQNATQLSLLLRQADLAMSAAKHKQIHYLLYNASLDNDAKSRLEIASNLDNALNNDEFKVHYQPIIKNPESHITHFEALLRWPVSGGGFIPPDQFIPIAEQSNLIRKITLLVLNRVAMDLQLLQQAGLNVCIHINLSVRDLQDDHLAEQLTKMLKQGQISTQQLVLEVTETALMQDLRATKQVLQRLVQLGFSVSLDDFGTGYSSLSMLLELPIQQIKIDRSFISNMNEGATSYAIVRSLIDMAHSLNCSVVAEGVETQELVEQLIRLKCDYLQGYYFSKALPTDALIAYCQQRQKTL